MTPGQTAELVEFSVLQCPECKTIERTRSDVKFGIPAPKWPPICSGCSFGGSFRATKNWVEMEVIGTEMLPRYGTPEPPVDLSELLEKVGEGVRSGRFRDSKKVS